MRYKFKLKSCVHVGTFKRFSLRKSDRRQSAVKIAVLLAVVVVVLLGTVETGELYAGPLLHQTQTKERTKLESRGANSFASARQTPRLPERQGKRHLVAAIRRGLFVAVERAHPQMRIDAVQTGNFKPAVIAKPTAKDPMSAVQTGGFGMAKKAPKRHSAANRGKVALLRSFDLPS